MPSQINCPVFVKSVACALALGCFVTPSTIAQDQRGRDGVQRSSEQRAVRSRFSVPSHTVLSPMLSAGGEGGLASSITWATTCFEAPAFAQGMLTGQQGWYTFEDAPLTPVISGDGALEGAQSLFLPAAAAPPTYRIGGFSPIAPNYPSRRVIFETLVMAPLLGGSDYSIVVQSSINGSLAGWMMFWHGDGDNDGIPADVLTLRDPDGDAGPLPNDLWETGAHWTPGQIHSVRVHLDPVRQRCEWFLDGALISSFEQALPAHVDQCVLYRNNYSLPGEVGRFDCPTLRLLVADCAADITWDDAVNVSDLLMVISAWGPCAPHSSACRADINGDDAVNVTDLLSVISGWGPCVEPTGACCVNGSCSTMTFSQCADAGGVYEGDGLPCDQWACGIGNNECVNRRVIGLGDTLASTTLATPSVDSGPVPCGTFDPNDVALDPDVWFEYTPDFSGVLRIDTRNSPPGVSNTMIAVYLNCPIPEEPVAIRCASTDPFFGTLAAMSMGVNAGESLLIRVANGFGTPAGLILLQLSIVPPPAHDECVTAQSFNTGTTNATVSHFGATPSSQPLPSCASGIPGPFGGDSWYRVQSWFTGHMKIQIGGDVPVIIIAYASCADADAGVALACSNGGALNVTFPVTIGQYIRIRLIARGWSAPGQIVMSFSVYQPPPPPPSNDECSGALTATLGTTATSNVSATANFAYPGGECIVGGPTNFGPDIWFLYTPDFTGSLRVDTQQTTGNVTDTVLAAYFASTAPACSNLVEIGCNDDSNDNYLSDMTVPVVNGQAVYIRVGSYDVGGEHGPISLRLTALP